MPPRRNSLRSAAVSASSSQPPREVVVSSKAPRASQSGMFTPAPPPPVPAWYVRKLIWIALLCIACGLAVVFVVPWGESNDATPETTDPRRTTTTETPPQYNTVLIEVDSLPPGARLKLDGLPAGNPPLRLRRENRTYALEISAPGFDTRVVNVTADRDQRVRGMLRASGGAQ